MGELYARLPPLNALRAFEAASRHLNFRLAAEELGVTQGAVAQHVRGLETVLGLKLFERHPRTLVLTESGRQYCVGVRRSFELLAAATSALTPQARHVTVSVTPTFAAKWLLSRLPDFTAAYPDIDLRVLATGRLSHFQSDAVDLAVRYGRPPFGAGLNAELLFEDVLVAVASPSLIQKQGHSNKNERLITYPLLHDAHNLWPEFLEQVLPRAPLSFKKNVRFNQTALAIDAAVAGQGMALAHVAFVETDVTAGRLVRIFPIEMATGAGFYLVSSRKPHDGELATSVRKWFLQQARSRGVEVPL